MIESGRRSGTAGSTEMCANVPGVARRDELLPRERLMIHDLRVLERDRCALGLVAHTRAS